jgi:hypothetical protein
VTGKRRRGRDEVAPPTPPTPATPAAVPPPPPPPAPVRPPVETVTLPPLTRRQLRIDRRKRRRKVGAAGIAGVAVLALIIIAAIAFGVHKAVTHSHHPVAQSQTTVLLQIQGPDRTALGSVLLAHDPAAGGTGVELLVPSQLITDVCGVGQVTFGQTLASGNGQQVSRQAVSAALGGITVDGSWVLSTTLFAQLVNAVGGVVVDVDTNVLSHGPNGAAVLDIPQGHDERLNGAKAVEYATYRASTGEDAAAQLARLSDVVDATIRALPATATGPSGVTGVLGQLGRGGASTLGADRLAALLVAMRHDDTRPGGVLPIGLPTTLIDTGGTPSYSVDTAKTTQLVEAHFTSSLPAVRPGPKITVELRNGVGSPGLVATACPRLAAAGLVYAGQGNAATFNNPTSEVQIASDSVTDRAEGTKVARALRLPASDVRLASLGQNQADVVVVLGRDYRP